MNDDKLIHSLVSDLKPVKRLPSIATRVFFWILSSVAVAVIEFFIIAKIRPEAIDMLKQNPRFAFETLLIILAPILAAIGAMFLSVPGNENKRWIQWTALFCFLGFLGMNIYNFWDPIFENSIHTDRGSCPIDIPLIGLIPLVPLFYLVRQAAPLNWKWISILITLAAFAPLAAMMQLSCTAGAMHVMVGHILPIVVMSGFVLILSRFFLRK